MCVHVCIHTCVFCNFDCMVRKGLSKKMIFEESRERGKGISHVAIWGKKKDLSCKYVYIINSKYCCFRAEKRL